MIERLEGEFLEVGAGQILVNIGGVGLKVLVPRPVIDKLGDAKRGVLYTRLLVRDGEPQLYGFSDLSERACFDTLLAVSGVGARIACAILSFLNPQEIAIAVETGSTDAFISVPGVGKKLASRILLESKGRLPIDLEQQAPASTAKVAGADAVQALTALGYSPNDSREVVREVLKRHGPKTPPLDELLREALVGLNRARG